MTDRRAFLAGVASIGIAGLVGCEPATRHDRSQTATSVGATPTEAEVDVRITGTIAEGLNVPWGIAFLPDGRALVAQRDAGTIIVVDPSAKPADRTRTLGEVPGVENSDGGEGGLLGLALDPDDSTSLYAYLTTATDNRVVRIELAGRRLGTIKPVLTGIPSGARHNGGRLAFGPDGHLYVGTGEATHSGLAQDKKSLGGKILRLSREGTVQRWSMGHRNVEGLAFDAAGRLWASEFGDHRFDELNLIRKGGNYGWPEVEGDSSDPRFVRPKATWPPAVCSPSGLAITRSTAFVAALRGERLWTVPLHGDRIGTPTAHFIGAYGRLRTVVVAPDGDLWVTTSNTDGRGNATSSDDRILRVAVGAR